MWNVTWNFLFSDDTVYYGGCSEKDVVVMEEKYYSKIEKAILNICKSMDKLILSTYEERN